MVKEKKKPRYEPMQTAYRTNVDACCAGAGQISWREINGQAKCKQSLVQTYSINDEQQQHQQPKNDNANVYARYIIYIPGIIVHSTNHADKVNEKSALYYSCWNVLAIDRANAIQRPIRWLLSLIFSCCCSCLLFVSFYQTAFWIASSQMEYIAFGGHYDIYKSNIKMII